MSKPPIRELMETKNVGKLVEALQHINSDYGVQAVRALAEVGDQTAVNPLVESLKNLSSNQDIATEAIITALIRIGSSHLEAIVALLESDDPTRKDIAPIILGEIGDPRAIDPLIKNLGSADECRKLRTIQALTNIGKKSVEPLIKALDNKDREIQKFVAEALFKIGNEQAVDAVNNIEFYDDLKNCTSKKLALHFKKRDVYFPDKCVYCGNRKEHINTHKIRADIIKNSERVKIHLPYCEHHIREGRKNKAILFALFFVFYLIPWFLTIYIVIQVKPNIVYGFLTIFIVAPIVFIILLSLMKYLLSKIIFSLRNISLDYLFSNADLGLTWNTKGPVIEFNFQNKEIATEFGRNLVNI